MNAPFLYVANWKMALSHTEACSLLEQYTALNNTIGHTDKKIVVCPSYTELAAASTLLASYKNISLGAQSCSSHRTGAHTGEISAATLAQVGVRYCLAGHSERRQHNHETNKDVAAQVERLLEHTISPIICIGETQEAFERAQTKNILEQQLELVIPVINQYANKTSVYFAYEPVWAIGTNHIPTREQLHDIFSWLQATCASYLSCSAGLLYGGSVQPTHRETLTTIPHCQGFLIGGASVDFQKFKNIVSW